MEPATSLESDAFPIDRSMLVGFVVAVVLLVIAASPSGAVASVIPARRNAHSA